MIDISIQQLRGISFNANKASEAHIRWMAQRILKDVQSDLERLKHVVGWRALKSLREGKSKLYLWRGSSPSNVFVENPRRPGNYIWHSGPGMGMPDFGMFILESESKDRIPHSPVHRQGGDAFLTTYVLRPEYKD